jgi:hypothetical protein
MLQTDVKVEGWGGVSGAATQDSGVQEGRQNEYFKREKFFQHSKFSKLLKQIK